MSEKLVPEGYLASNQPDLFFEDNAVGRLKKEVWEASDEEIDAILADYGVPSPVEWGKPGSYIQTTTRWKVEENRKKIYNEMNPPMGTPRNPFNMFVGRPFYVKCKLVSNFNNFDDSQFIDLQPQDGALRIQVKNAQGQENWQVITQEVIAQNPDVKPLVLNYLKENCPSLAPYEYHAWTSETTNFVNSCIKIYTNPQASMQAATGMQAAAMPAANPYMQPAMQPQVSPAAPAQSVMPTSMPTAPVAGLEMGADATSMNQTTPGGFNAANIPGVGNGELDSILNGGVPAAAPTNPASNMSLDDVLTGIM